MPTLILLTPSVNCLLIICDPIKFPLEIRSLEIAHLRFASTGVLSLFSSFLEVLSLGSLIPLIIVLVDEQGAIIQKYEKFIPY